MFKSSKYWIFIADIFYFIAAIYMTVGCFIAVYTVPQENRPIGNDGSMLIYICFAFGYIIFKLFTMTYESLEQIKKAQTASGSAKIKRIEIADALLFAAAFSLTAVLSVASLYLAGGGDYYILLFPIIIDIAYIIIHMIIIKQVKPHFSKEPQNSKQSPNKPNAIKMFLIVTNIVFLVIALYFLTGFILNISFITKGYNDILIPLCLFCGYAVYTLFIIPYTGTFKKMLKPNSNR